MSRLHTLKTITASATLLFAFSLSFASLAGAAPQKVAAPAKVAAHRARVSPPHAGVKLLEDILSRMRNLPMIAMARNKQTFQYQQASQNAAPAQGATDQLLAIRPKESSYKMNAGKRKSTIAMAEPRASFGSSRIAGNSYAKYDDARSTQANEGTMRRAQSQPGDYKDSYSSPSNLLAKKRSNMSQMPSSLPSSGMGAYVPNAYQASNKGIQNFDTATREITERL